MNTALFLVLTQNLEIGTWSKVIFRSQMPPCLSFVRSELTVMSDGYFLLNSVYSVESVLWNTLNNVTHWGVDGFKAKVYSIFTLELI